VEMGGGIERVLEMERRGSQVRKGDVRKRVGGKSPE
jgi:hypothetical protein